MADNNRSLALAVTPTPRHEHLTVAQANRALVLVRKIVADIVAQYVQLDDLQEVLEAASQSGRYDLAENTRDQSVQRIDTIETYANELSDVGVRLKDWTIGLVDLPHLAGGRQVSLCWRPDDQDVQFWHETDAECLDRKPIATLPVAETSPA